MPLFPVLLLVLELRDVLVALDLLRRLPGSVEIQLARVLGTHGDVGKQAREIGALTLRAGSRIAGSQELLELVMAAPALVFVDRHGEFITRTTPNSQLPPPKRSRKTAKVANRVTAILGIGSWQLGVAAGYTERSSGRGSAW